MAQEIVWEFVRSVLELFGISRGSVRAVVFFGFYAVTAFALYFHDDGRVRKIYLGFLFVAIITPMLVVMNVWPFYRWSPLHSAGVNNATDYDIYLVDQNGKELQYDSRASPPLTRSPLKRYAQKMANEYNVSENKEFSKFLLKNACLYRKKVENGSSLLPSLDFPKGQIDYKWSEGELKNISEFKGIRVYKYDTQLTDRAELISRERSLSIEIWHNETC